MRDVGFVDVLLGIDSLSESWVSGEKMDSAVSRVFPSFVAIPGNGAVCFGFPSM